MIDPPSNAAGLIVMYHYVRPDRSVIPAGIRPLLVSEFETQLDWLCERYDIVGANEFLGRLNGEGSGASEFVGSASRTDSCGAEQTVRGADPTRIAPGYPESGNGRWNSKPPCLLTFDDGTKDHAQVATPILKRRGLTGVFFVLTWPAELRRMPLTHAVHWLLGQGDDGVWNSFKRYASDHLGGEESLGDPSQAQRIYHYESPTRARIKYAANMALPPEATEQIVEASVISTGRTMGDLAEEWFVSADDIREMAAAGMTIASHGASHRSLQTLGAAGMSVEINHSCAYIERLTGRKPKWFACPFGASGASADAINQMRDAMTHAGIVASVSTEKRYVHSTENAYALPRLDTIELPPRKSEA